MNHEQRIKQLEKELSQLKQILAVWGLTNNWIPLNKAEIVLGQSSWVIRKKIKSDPHIKLGVHYRMNGNRYQINPDAWTINN